MRLMLAALLFATACTTDMTAGAGDGDSPVDVSADATPKITPIRGADRASEISVAEAKLLKNSHGVKYFGVYIGGPCNGGSGWSKAGVTAIANATGWKFAPIYVGQQSSSICRHHTVTAKQGTIDAKATVSDLKAFGWQPNRDIPVFLDVEAGTYFASPLAATAYVRAWVNEIHTLGYRADVYGSPFAMNTFHDAGVKIDGVWAASYFYRGFANVVPADLDQMGSRYRKRNRSWQYAGDFFVSGVGDIDADTANMLLAPRPGGTNRATTSHRELPVACGALETTEGLANGESIRSCDGAAELTLADDGTLALTANGARVWSMPTAGGATAVLEDNGELAVFDADQNPVFVAGTGGHPDAHLEIAATGLQVVDDDGTQLWTSADGLVQPDDVDADADAGDVAEPATDLQ